MATSQGVFGVMEKEDLTTLEVFYNQKKNRFLMRGMKEWDDTIRWDRYMTDFTYEDILTEDYKAIGTAKLQAIFEKQGLSDYLHRIEELIRDGRNHGIEFYYNHSKNIRVLYCKHVNTLGIRNRRHAIRAGAMRRHELSTPEIDVVSDGLNIARAMAYKNATANIPYGGSKILVQCDPVYLNDFETMGFIAYVTDRSRSFTGPDMGFTPEMADIIREKFTKNYTDGRKSSMGSSGAPTAYGEFLAIKEACNFVYGSSDLSNRKVAVQGLGEVGFPLAEHLLKDGARLIVTDVNMPKVQRLQQKWGGDRVKYAEPDAIYTVTADIFSPCAMGGVITEERIKQFKFKVIMGSANNQLKATSKEGEIKLAQKLADAGILFVVAWAHNACGVLCACVEWTLQEEACQEKFESRINLVCHSNLRQLLEDAKSTGKIPTEIAYERVEEAVYSGAEYSDEF